MVTLLDDFNRADAGPPPSANWGIIQSGLPELQVVSNQAKQPTAAGSGTDAWLPLQGLSNCAVEFVVGTTATVGGFRVYTRLTGLNSTTYTCYALRIEFNWSNTISRYDSGSSSATTLASFTQAHAVGDTFRLQSMGGVHQAWYTPSGGQPVMLAQASDGTYGSGYIGMGISVDLLAGFDSFSGGSLDSSIRIPIPMRSRGGNW